MSGLVGNSRRHVLSCRGSLLFLFVSTEGKVWTMNVTGLACSALLLKLFAVNEP